MFRSPLLQDKTKPCRGQGEMLPTRCGSISLAPPAPYSSGDERSPRKGMGALLEILAELLAVSVGGSQRSRAVPSGLPS